MNKTDINNRFIEAVNEVLSSYSWWNKKEIAMLLGITSNKFSEILNSRMNAGIDTIALFCEKFEVNLTYIVYGKGELFVCNTNNNNTFPFTSIDQITGKKIVNHGLTKREYFAALAMQATDLEAYAIEHRHKWAIKAAKDAVIMADEMILALSKK